MQSPTDARMKDLKRLVCYIAGKPHVVTHFAAQQCVRRPRSTVTAVVKGVALGSSLKALLADWGIEVSITVLSDSSAARGTASRLGKHRHVKTRFLWLQERVACADIKLEAVDTRKNLADLLRKPMTRDEASF